MRAPESPFEHYMSKQILFFTYLMCSSVSGAKSTKKSCLRFAVFNFSEKLQNIFEIRFKNMECLYKIALIVKIFWKKKFAVLIVYVLIYPLSKFGGNQTNSLWVLAFYSVCFKWKNWFEKTALNMSIRRVIFTSGQNLKPPFLCQYLKCLWNEIFVPFFILENWSLCCTDS